MLKVSDEGRDGVTLQVDILSNELELEGWKIGSLGKGTWPLTHTDLNLILGTQTVESEQTATNNPVISMHTQHI